MIIYIYIDKIQRINLSCKPKEITSKKKLRSENQFLKSKLANQLKLVRQDGVGFVPNPGGNEKRDQMNPSSITLNKAGISAMPLQLQRRNVKPNRYNFQQLQLLNQLKLRFQLRTKKTDCHWEWFRKRVAVYCSE
ncbi:Hypothetical_protein [Hexamita inflata]|uniref:Hypothetical_protein n=1 Tax=Hexamita inflata TaxID=28002 RepID=A0AA86PD84_9EUKA|nr:Hypothetical protein HINF_LOCUS24500 [Hexamita inflata]